MDTWNLQKISGIGAILAGIVAFIGIALIASSDVMTSEEGAEVMTAIDADKEVLAPAAWLLTLGPLLMLGALAGIYQKLRSAGDVMRIALIAVAVNLLFVIIGNVLLLGVAYEIVTPWIDAGADPDSSLVIVNNAILTMSLIIRVVGDAVGIGIGILLFSIAILKTNLAPKWIGWLGLLAALGAWLGLFVSVSDIFGIFGMIGAVALFIWLIGLGATMVRSSEA